MKYKYSSLFIHKQIVRYLIESYTKISTKELIEILQKLLPPINNDKIKKENIIHIYQLLLEKVGNHLNEQNASFLFEYFGISPLSQSHISTPITTPNLTTPIKYS